MRPGLDLVEETVSVAGLELSLLRPRDAGALLDEHAFEQEEYLPYWAELWPSALALAEAIGAWEGAAGARVLELGCGLGLPSLVAALAGARVLATDWSPEAVEVAAANAARNGARIAAERWSWAEDPGVIGGRCWRLVVAADVLYERRNGPQLLAVLPELVAAGGEAWIADPGRATAEPFWAEAAAHGWSVDALIHGGPPRVAVRRLRRRGSG